MSDRTRREPHTERLGQIMKNDSKSSGRCPSKGRSRRLFAAAIAVLLWVAPTVAPASEGLAATGREGGLGAAAALSTLVYAPVKLVYATGGLLVSGFAWAFTAGDSGVAETVLTRSLRGNYVVTPDHLTGEQPLVFIGRDVAGTSSEKVAAVSAAPPPEDPELDTSGYDENGW